MSGDEAREAGGWLRERLDAWDAGLRHDRGPATSNADVCMCASPEVCPVAADRKAIDAVRAVLTRSAELEADNARMREELAASKPVKYGPTGTGVPATMHLEAFGQTVRQAFGHVPYHVGTSAVSKTGWRDVDVRLMLPDDEFDALFPGYDRAHHIDALWSLICAAISELGRVRTGLPIDFQIQRTSDANEKYPGFRAPLMLITADDEPRPARLAPQQPAPSEPGRIRAEQQPEPCDGDCDCDCQPGQPCLCPERDCYCGPCPVCDRDEDAPRSAYGRSQQ